MPILLKSQPWNRADDENPEVEVEWNMWQRRLYPWDELAVGRRVILVSCGGPRAGVLTYRVEVTGVVKVSYASHEDAWRQLKDGLGETLVPDLLDRDGFLDHEYTVSKPVSGWLLGWTYRIVDEVRLPRPADLRMNRNGWGSLEHLALPDDVSGDGPTHDKVARAMSAHAGQIVDPLLRQRVEWHAMDAVRAWLESCGHAADDIVDTSANRPYDFEVLSSAGPMLRVEVKGTLSGLGTVQVTRREVEHARTGGVPTALAVVHDIELFSDDHDELQPLRGHLSVVDPWDPTDVDLAIVGYHYNAERAVPQDFDLTDF